MEIIKFRKVLNAQSMWEKRELVYTQVELKKLLSINLKKTKKDTVRQKRQRMKWKGLTYA